MNWGRAKTILIFLFLATDLFLLLVLMRINMTSVRIPQETIEDTVRIMAAHQVEVEAEQIPADRVKNRSMIMQNLFHEPVVAAKMFLGEEFKTVTIDDAAFVYSYENSLGSLTVTENGFLYSRAAQMKPYRVHPLPDAETMKNSISEALWNFGFEKGSFVLENLREQEGIFEVEAAPVVDDVKIYGIRMHIAMDAEGILTIGGHWFSAVETEENEPELLPDVTSVLTEMTLKNKIPAGKVLHIEFGFYADGDFLSSRELAAVPVYVIQDAQGRITMFDARVGEAVE